MSSYSDDSKCVVHNCVCLFSCYVSQLLSEEADKVSTPRHRSVSLIFPVRNKSHFMSPHKRFSSLFLSSPPGRAWASRCSDWVWPTSRSHQTSTGRHQQHSCECTAQYLYLRLSNAEKVLVRCFWVEGGNMTHWVDLFHVIELLHTVAHFSYSTFFIPNIVWISLIPNRWMTCDYIQPVKKW